MNQRTRKRRPIAEINITPFTDVILVLLVIYMITTPLILQSRINVNLPQAGSGKVKAAAKQINVTLTDKNLIYLEDAPVTKEQLKERVRVLHKDNPALKVILFSDKSVRFRDIVTVLDALKEIGVRNLGIAAKAGPNDV